MASTHEELATMIDDCEKRESKLTEWEIGFIDSISKQFSKSGFLTGKQIDKLESIWDRVTS